ncbi:MAG: hypothetical protein AAF517_10270 [Planctomycetota bacterium]
MPLAQWPSPEWGGGVLPDRIPRNTPSRPIKPQAVSFEPDSYTPSAYRLASRSVLSLEPVVPLDSDEQVRVLKSFFYNTLAGGTQPFEWSLPWNYGTDAARTVEFRFRRGTEPEFVWLEAEIWRASISLVFLS